MHDDGVSYAGAYAYFLNPHWNIHWGGLLLMLAKETTAQIDSYKKQKGPYNFVQKKWIDESEEAALVWDPGLAQCIFPKHNRIVFIANDVFHLVTTVNASAEDNARRSLAGFFDRGKKID